MIQKKEDQVLLERLMVILLKDPMTKTQLVKDIGIAYVTLYNLMFAKRSPQFSVRLKIEAYCIKREEEFKK